MPLPPYITHAASKSDESRYQTVYAKEPGAVAAPTAGLHFTDELLKDIKALGCEEVFVTLHVGAGTFQPVRSEKLSEHKMHSEWYHIDQKQQMPSTKHLRKEEEWFALAQQVCAPLNQLQHLKKTTKSKLEYTKPASLLSPDINSKCAELWSRTSICPNQPL